VAVSSGGGGATKPNRARPNTLRQAASAVFALTAIVPLLIFVWAVHHLDGLSVLQAQVALGLALAVALVGYFIFRGLMGRMSDLILSLGRAMELRERSGVGARASAEAPRPTVEPAAAAGPWAAPSPTRAPGPPAATWAAEHADVTAPPEETHTVTGLGAIREVHDLSRAMGVLWRAEAIAYKGRRVAVSVLSSPRPVIGTLIELTDEGLLVQTDGSGRVAVSFTRISAIDAGELATED
jgi:hypothetical protein